MGARIGPPAPPLRVAWFGTYDRGVGRNAILIDGLRAAGVEVVECHAALWRDTAAKLTAVAGRDRRALLSTAGRQLVAWARLARLAHHLGAIDALVVGPTAHLDLPLARFVADRLGAVLVFDPLISAAETARDRVLFADGSLRARAMRAVERGLFALPDVVLVDTAAHGRSLAADVGLDPTRAVVLPVGAPVVYRDATAAFGDIPPRPAMRVVYCGQYIPLHGVDIMLRAADRLRDRADIAFELVGLGQGLSEARVLADDLHLPNVRFVAQWLEPAELAARHLAAADVCLGIFGTSPKAAVVVPHKAYMALAAGRALITGDTPAARELLGPGEALLVPPGDPTALAAAIARLADDPAERARLASAGHAAWSARFAPDVLGRRLAAVLEAAVRVDRAPRMVGPRHRWRTERLATALEAALSRAVPPGGGGEAGDSGTGLGSGSGLAPAPAIEPGQGRVGDRNALDVGARDGVGGDRIASGAGDRDVVGGDRIAPEAGARDVVGASARVLLDAGCGDGSLALALAGSAIDVGAESTTPASDGTVARAATAASAGTMTGTGTGTGTSPLKPETSRPVVLACDRDLGRVRLAADRARARGVAGRVLPFVADIAALPLADAAVVGITAGEVLEHVADDAAAVRELARVLAPGGALAVTVPAGPGRLDGFDRGVGHVRRYDAAGLGGLLSGAGLDVERLVAWGVPFGRLYDAGVQRPALRARGRARSVAARLGRSRAVDVAWRGLFAVDAGIEGVVARVPALRARASGLIAVGRRGRRGRRRAGAAGEREGPLA